MTWQRLETDTLPRTARVVVIGSGYGGGAVAARIAADLPAGETLILERGREWLPGEFPDSWSTVQRNVRTPRNPMGLFDLALGTDVDRLVGCGLGGGSLINAGVMLQPLPDVFDDVWPELIDADELAPHVERVLEVLKPTIVTTPPDRTRPLEKLARRHGVSVTAVPVAISHRPPGENGFGFHQTSCTGCGNCMTGCNIGAKTTVHASYLPLAARRGAAIVTRTEVRAIVPSPDPTHRWRLTGWRYEYELTHYRRVEFTLDADVVVLAAGALGSTGILLRSARAGLPLSTALGSRFSGNGDAIAISYNSATVRQSGIGAADQQNPDLDVGPTITRMLDMRTESPGYVVQDAAVPWPIAQLLRRLLGARFALARDSRVYCDLRPGGCPVGCSALEHSQTWLAMGNDSAAGVVRLDARGEPVIRWTKAGQQEVYKAQHADFAALSEYAESTFVTNPRHAVLNRGIAARSPITVHPLGGAPMAESVEQGVVDDSGRVFAPSGGIHEGLYVLDGAICPRSVGANPALTIAALAERGAAKIRESGILHQAVGVSPIEGALS